MITLLSIIAVGFVLGMRHATDPDHVVAVTTIVSRQSSIRLAAWVGALWGAGHTLTITLVGGAIILFNLVIPPALELSMELAVGFMLVLLGALNLKGMLGSIRRAVPGAAPHDHGRRQAHHLPSLDGPALGLSVRQVLRPVIVGVVHGLAGSAAVALLVLTTIQNVRWAVAYLIVYGIGTIAGMVIVTMAVAAPFASGQRRSPVMGRRLQTATGVLSIAFGLLLAYKIGFVDGLFLPGPMFTR